MAAGPEALACPHPRHYEAESLAREYRSCFSSTDAGRPARSRKRCIKNHGSRGALPGTPAETRRTLSVTLPKGRKRILTALAGWENCYVIVGSSAGALIGLQFVVIMLIADMPIARADA